MGHLTSADRTRAVPFRGYVGATPTRASESDLSERALGSTLLARAVLAPPTPHLDTVRRVLDDLTDPLECWERLHTHNLQPPSWLPGVERLHGRLHEDHGDGRSRGECRVRVVRSEAPVSRAATEALAARGDLVARCEVLAVEAVSRAWGSLAPVHRVVWSTAPRASLRGPRGTLLPSFLAVRLAAIATRSPALERAYDRARHDLLRHATPDRDLRPVARDFARSTLWRLSLGHLPNPFAPLLELWSLGVVPDTFEDTTLYLTMPEAPPPRVLKSQRGSARTGAPWLLPSPQ